MDNIKYKVVKTWYITAESTTEAIAKSKQVLHDKVEASQHFVLPELNDFDGPELF